MPYTFKPLVVRFHNASNRAVSAVEADDNAAKRSTLDRSNFVAQTKTVIRVHR